MYEGRAHVQQVSNTLSVFWRKEWSDLHIQRNQPVMELPGLEFFSVAGWFSFKQIGKPCNICYRFYTHLQVHHQLLSETFLPSTTCPKFTFPQFLSHFCLCSCTTVPDFVQFWAHPYKPLPHNLTAVLISSFP